MFSKLQIIIFFVFLALLASFSSAQCCLDTCSNEQCDNMVPQECDEVQECVLGCCIANEKCYDSVPSFSCQNREGNFIENICINVPQCDLLKETVNVFPKYGSNQDVFEIQSLTKQVFIKVNGEQHFMLLADGGTHFDLEKDDGIYAGIFDAQNYRFTEPFTTIKFYEKESGNSEEILISNEPCVQLTKETNQKRYIFVYNKSEFDNKPILRYAKLHQNISIAMLNDSSLLYRCSGNDNTIITIQKNETGCTKMNNQITLNHDFSKLNPTILPENFCTSGIYDIPARLSRINPNIYILQAHRNMINSTNVSLNFVILSPYSNEHFFKIYVNSTDNLVSSGTMQANIPVEMNIAANETDNYIFIEAENENGYIGFSGFHEIIV